jgi:hypothetical protein
MNSKTVIVCLLGFIPLGLFAKELPAGNVPCFLPRPVNVIPDSPLSENDGCPEWPSSEKRQYSPVNDELPIFSEQTSEADYEGGAFYREEVELYIKPEFGFTTTSESIEEDTGALDKPECHS